MFVFTNGTQVIEKTTGFAGVIICRTEWANGQITYDVQPPAEDSSYLPGTETFDEEFLLLPEEME